MKIKFTERGHFMVEMLSILIIIGVLSVAGIIRYQDALAYQAGTVRDLLEKQVENVELLGTYQVGEVVFEEEKVETTEKNNNWIEKMSLATITDDFGLYSKKVQNVLGKEKAMATKENTNWTEKMLLAAITDDFGLYFECTSNMDMSSYLQQPHSVTALKLAMMHDSYGFIISLIGNAAYQESKNNNNMDATQGVYSYLKQEVSQDDLLQALRDNPIKSLPQEDQEWATNFVAQVFASEKFTKADEMAIQLMKYPARGIFRHLLPNALHFLAKNDFKISQSEKMEQYISDVQLKVDKLIKKQDKNKEQDILTVEKLIDQGAPFRLNDKQ
ncbi:MAG: hypothetical protein IKJ28_04465 [Alphaproteobacteria bacterium]|nr:hypothetical protein [Alphaproteobacteria bacterium]